MAQLPLIRQNQAGTAHIDGATPSYLPTSINQPNQNMPHRWRISFPEAAICPQNRACFQTIPNHIDGASQARAWWWDKSLFLNAFATANPPQPAELPCLGRAWMAQVRKGLDDEDTLLFCKCVLLSRLRGAGNECLVFFRNMFVKICWKMRFLSVNSVHNEF